jgi:hypothetical protein
MYVDYGLVWMIIHVSTGTFEVMSRIASKTRSDQQFKNKLARSKEDG